MKLPGLLLDLLFPPKCPFCHRLLRSGETGFCSACQAALPWTGGGDRPKQCVGISRCESPLWYRGSVPDSFHRYKFSGCSSYAEVYGTLMAQCAKDRLAGTFDVITWAPLSAKRKRKRGYDQSFLLARVVARELNAPLAAALCKVRDTAAQSSLEDDASRARNVSGVYRADPALAAGKRVLLIDDVVTTGSTLSQCAEALRAAGAADVCALTLARARE